MKMNFNKLVRQYREQMDMYFTPNATMTKRYPKAAKRERVRKKWLRRFGPDVDWAEVCASSNPFINSFNQESSAIWHSEHSIDITAMLKDPPNDADL